LGIRVDIERTSSFIFYRIADGCIKYFPLGKLLQCCFDKCILVNPSSCKSNKPHRPLQMPHALSSSLTLWCISCMVPERLPHLFRTSSVSLPHLLLYVSCSRTSIDRSGNSPRGVTKQRQLCSNGFDYQPVLILIESIQYRPPKQCCRAYEHELLVLSLNTVKVFFLKKKTLFGYNTISVIIKSVFFSVGWQAPPTAGLRPRHSLFFFNSIDMVAQYFL